MTTIKQVARMGGKARWAGFVGDTVTLPPQKKRGRPAKSPQETIVVKV